MINQRNPGLLPVLQKEGCYFLSLLYLVERETGKQFSVDIINGLFQTFLDKKYLGPDCLVKNPTQILKHLGLNKTQRLNGSSIAFPASYKTQNNELEILEYVNGIFSHFVVGDGNSRVEFDPLVNSNTVRNGRLNSKRIFA